MAFPVFSVCKLLSFYAVNPLESIRQTSATNKKLFKLNTYLPNQWSFIINIKSYAATRWSARTLVFSSVFGCMPAWGGCWGCRKWYLRLGKSIAPWNLHSNYVTFFIIVWNSIEQRQRARISSSWVSQRFRAIACIEFLSSAPNLKIASGICESKRTAWRGATKNLVTALNPNHSNILLGILAPCFLNKSPNQKPTSGLMNA